MGKEKGKDLFHMSWMPINGQYLLFHILAESNIIFYFTVTFLLAVLLQSIEEISFSLFYF
jgi:hypothetical protein